MVPLAPLLVPLAPLVAPLRPLVALLAHLARKVLQAPQAQARQARLVP